MENNSDRMGFALIALSVVAFVLLAVNGPLKSTVEGFFNGYKDWQTQTFDGINESNKQDVTHTAYSWSSDGTDRFYVASGTNLAHGTSSDWQKASVQTSDWGIKSLCDPIYEIINGETYTVQVEVRNITAPVMLEPYFFNTAGKRDYTLAQAQATDKDGKISITFTAHLPDNYAYFKPNLAFTKPTTGAGSYEFRQFKVEKGSIATSWSPAPSEAHPKYIGTYTDKSESASQDPSKYTWKLNPDYHE